MSQEYSGTRVSQVRGALDRKSNDQHGRLVELLKGLSNLLPFPTFAPFLPFSCFHLRLTMKQEEGTRKSRFSNNFKDRELTRDEKGYRPIHYVRKVKEIGRG